MEYRLTQQNDLPVLAELRWQYHLEENGNCTTGKNDFVKTFMDEAGKPDWFHWLAVEDQAILGCACIRKIRKLPRPEPLESYIGYLTNMYVAPDFRNQGIGSELLKHITSWSHTEKLQLMVVWPSEKSVGFYVDGGFSAENEILEYKK
jgi:GNAT superfamily N-acetyltransferase